MIKQEIKQGCLLVSYLFRIKTKVFNSMLAKEVEFGANKDM